MCTVWCVGGDCLIRAWSRDVSVQARSIAVRQASRFGCKRSCNYPVRVYTPPLVQRYPKTRHIGFRTVVWVIYIYAQIFQKALMNEYGLNYIGIRSKI